MDFDNDYEEFDKRHGGDEITAPDTIAMLYGRLQSLFADASGDERRSLLERLAYTECADYYDELHVDELKRIGEGRPGRELFPVVSIRLVKLPTLPSLLPRRAAKSARKARVNRNTSMSKARRNGRKAKASK